MEINGLQILFQIINFGVVFGAITVLLYKPIIKMLDERRRKIEEGQLAAQQALQEKEEIESLKKKSKTQAEKEAAKVMDQAQDEAKKLESKLTKEVREEIKKLKEKEMKKWDEEKAAKMKEMEKQVEQMAIAIASKVLGQEVDKKTHTTLIAKSMKELEAAL